MRNDSLSTWEGRHGPQKPTEDRKQGVAVSLHSLPVPCPPFQSQKISLEVTEVIGKTYSYVLRGARLQLSVLFQPDAQRQPHKALEAPHTYIPGRVHDPGG